MGCLHGGPFMTLSLHVCVGGFMLLRLPLNLKIILQTDIKVILFQLIFSFKVQLKSIKDNREKKEIKD